MKLTCNTILDVLPLVAENLASEDTERLVNQHIIHCSNCRKEFEELKMSKENFESKRELESIPLKEIKKKLKNKNIYTGVITALIISLLLIIGFNKATRPIPLSFAQAVESTEIEGSKLFIKFTSNVSDYSIVSNNYGGTDYEIMAWRTRTNNSKLSKREVTKNPVISIDEEKPVIVRYISQETELDKLIYGKEEGYSLTLPRLALNYYLFVMLIIFVISIVLSLIFRKTNKIKKTFNIIMFLALSYILSHIVNIGMKGSTHHIIRDLLFVVVTAVLFFALFILTIYKNNFLKKDNK